MLVKQEHCWRPWGLGYSEAHADARRRGFTLVELVVVMTIAALLVSLATSSYQTATTNYRLSTEGSTLVNFLQFARSEAIKRGMTVTVCASSDGSTCSGVSSWQSGYIVVTNPSNNAGPSGIGATGQSTLLRAQSALPAGDTATGRDQNAAAVAAVSFSRSGFAGIPGGAWNSFSPLSAQVAIALQPQAASTTLGVCVVIANPGQISLLSRSNCWSNA